MKTPFIALALVCAACASAAAPAAHPELPAPFVDAPKDALLLAYIKRHPDPAISVTFAAKIAAGDILIRIETPKQHALASFGPYGTKYVLTFSPELLMARPDQDAYEHVLAILSHEHAHYRQYVEGEMTNYHIAGTRSETQCTLTILVEVDASVKACRDVEKYQWKTASAQMECQRTILSLADYFLKERVADSPECRPVWESFRRYPSAPAETCTNTVPSPP